MARTSKKPGAAAPARPRQEALWQTAIYARLSREDNLSGSLSIEHQLALCKAYLKEKPMFALVDVFSDNGFTGTDFERPEWQRLMEAVRTRKINCIVVKDLSRLGRNYIETGEFLEKLCPFFGVRFISINDGFDTDTADSGRLLSASLSNIVNDCYAKDISRKICSALRSKAERGEYIGHWAKYGYLRDPARKNHLVVDPETAPVVRMIFELRARGISYAGINRTLNELGIPSPGQLKANRGIVTNNNQKPRTILWSKHSLTDLLQDITYLGHLAQRKNVRSLYRGLPSTPVSREDWVVVRNTHAPIIDGKLFCAVQEVNRRSANRHRQRSGTHDNLPRAVNLYGKKFTCADCGRTMKLCRSVSTGGDRAYFTFKCPTHEEHGDRGCQSRRIRQADLDRAVLAALRSQFDLFLEKKELLERLRVRAEQNSPHQGNKRASEELNRKLTLKKSLFAGLYQDLREGLLSDEEYVRTREQLRAEIARLEQDLEGADLVQSRTEQITGELEQWNTLADRYCQVREITTPLVETMLHSIQLHADNTLTIQFNYMDGLETIVQQTDKLREEIT